ncbi:MAG: internal scaffolding protein [Microvirus sp.]|nr:MAG: internal scaffolding protein [Microvirus sp.]
MTTKSTTTLLPLSTKSPLKTYKPDSSLPFTSAYSPKSRISITFPTLGRTKQSFKDECDINTIMAQYMRTGILDNLNKRPPRYIDASGIEFQASMQLIADAKQAFSALPSQLRDRFHNDPARFLHFLDNPENREEAIKLGLVQRTDSSQGGSSPQGSGVQPAPVKTNPQGGSPGELPQTSPKTGT